MKWAWRGALFGGGILIAVLFRGSELWRALERAAGLVADQIDNCDDERDRRLGKHLAAEMKRD